MCGKCWMEVEKGVLWGNVGRVEGIWMVGERDGLKVGLVVMDIEKV